jgi:cytidylate kinase
MKYIVLTGDLASFKTTIARQLKADLGLPVLIKDDLKEVLFDAFESMTDTIHKQLSSVTLGLMKSIARTYQSKAVILEGNFKPHEVERLRRDFPNTLWFFVTAEEAIRYDRYLTREPSRHQAHKRYGLLSKESFSRANREPADHMVIVDTTHFSEADYETMIEQIIGFVHS